MRDKLSRMSNQYVLCKGWIDGWWDIDETTKRFCIKNPIIKKPDKNLLFENQELISKEDHLNLFLKKEDEYKFMSCFEKLDPIYFSGIIKGYTRSDGSKDYGIHPIEQSQIHFKLGLAIEQLNEVDRNYKNPYTKEFLYYLELIRRPKILGILKELEDVGDLLPTFFHTHKEYKKFLETELIVCQTDIKYLRQISSSRRSRRSRGIPYDFSKEIPTFEEFQEQQQQIVPYGTTTTSTKGVTQC